MKLAFTVPFALLLFLGLLPAAAAQKVPSAPPPQPLRAPCGLGGVAYDWDFSQGDQGFQEVDCDGAPSPGLWEWGWTSAVPDLPGTVWGTSLNGSYPNSSGDGLLSPWFFVSEAARYVEVYHWFSTEAGYDGCNVSAGPGGWPDNSIIFPIAGYTTPQINSSSGYYALCVDNEPGWTGPDATWRVDCFDLAGYMNQWIRLQFDFGADESVSGIGWFLSRVRVGAMEPTEGACCDFNTGSCFLTTHAACVEAGEDWHGEWTSCSPNPCPQPVPHGGVAMGGWSDAEPWHDWVSSVPGSMLPIEVRPGDMEGHILSVDFFTSSDGGWSWQYAGNDADGAEPHFNTTSPDVFPVGDGWSLTVPVPNLPAGSPFLYKAMVHTDSGDRVVEGESETDPAPPSLGTTSVHDMSITDRDTLGVEVDPNGTEVIRVVIFLGAMTDNFVKGIPGIDQHIVGSEFCAPTAAAQCLKYFEGQGDYTVTGGLDNLELVTALSAYMNTHPVLGTTPSNWWGGLQSWIDDHGNGYTVRQVKHYSRDGHLTFSDRDWRLMRNELERCQDVLLGVFWLGGGGHALTLDAIVNTALPNGRILLGFKDPWTGQSSQGELDASTGIIHNMTGAGGGRSGYAGVTMIASPKESDVNEGGPGLAIYDGLPPGEPPYHIIVPLPEPGEWTLHVVLVNSLGNAYRSSYLVVRAPAGDVSAGEPATQFALGPALPNPFRERTELWYAVPSRTHVSLAVFDVAGREVRRLAEGEVEAGVHQVSWNGTDARSREVSPGVYFVKMQAGTWSRTRMLTLLR